MTITKRRTAAFLLVIVLLLSLSIGAITSAGAVPYAPGDVNGDTKVDVEDILLCRNAIFGEELSPEAFGAADVNGDGKVDIDDLLWIRDIIFGKKPPTRTATAPRPDDTATPQVSAMEKTTPTLEPPDTWTPPLPATFSASIQNATPTYNDVLVTINYPPDITIQEFSTTSASGPWTSYNTPITFTANGTVWARGKRAIDAVFSVVTSYTVSNINKTPPAITSGATYNIKNIGSDKYLNYIYKHFGITNTNVGIKDYVVNTDYDELVYSFKITHIGNGEYYIQPCVEMDVRCDQCEQLQNACSGCLLESQNSFVAVDIVNSKRDLVVDVGGSNTTEDHKRWHIVAVDGGYCLINKAYPFHIVTMDGPMKTVFMFYTAISSNDSVWSFE